MNSYASVLVIALLATALGVQTGCDQNETLTDPESSEVFGKGSEIGSLGQRLAKDHDFRALRKLLHDADKKARLKYFAGADLQKDLEFATEAERKGSLSRSEKSRLAAIRGLSEKDFQKLSDLRGTIIEHFPELLYFSEQELQDVLAEAGVGDEALVGKTFDACSACNYNYNTCMSNAQFRHAIEVMSCALLIETVIGGSVCYLASVSKYMWTVSSCSRTRQYCLSNNGCNGVSERDTT